MINDFSMNGIPHVTEENVNELKGRSLYGKKYQVGDYIFLVQVSPGYKKKDYVIELRTLTQGELERFNNEYELSSTSHFFIKRENIE